MTLALFLPWLCDDGWWRPRTAGHFAGRIEQVDCRSRTKLPCQIICDVINRELIEHQQYLMKDILTPKR